MMQSYVSVHIFLSVISLHCSPVLVLLCALSLQPVPMETLVLEINSDLRFSLTASFVLS